MIYCALNNNTFKLFITEHTFKYGYLFCLSFQLLILSVLNLVFHWNYQGALILKLKLRQCWYYPEV